MTAVLIVALFGLAAFCAVALAVLVFIGCFRCAAEADRRAEVVQARSREVPFTVTDCDCADCARGPATYEQPHLDPNSCSCPMCVAVIAFFRIIADDDCWDRGLAELEPPA